MFSLKVCSEDKNSSTVKKYNTLPTTNKNGLTK